MTCAKLCRIARHSSEVGRILDTGLLGARTGGNTSCVEFQPGGGITAVVNPCNRSSEIDAEVHGGGRARRLLLFLAELVPRNLDASRVALFDLHDALHLENVEQRRYWTQPSSIAALRQVRLSPLM